jgi:hypothetical protein
MTALTAEQRQVRTLAPDEVAWLAAVPAAAIALLAILLLGPPLGEALLAPGGVRFWPSRASDVNPEPVEQGRFLIALLAPLLLTALTVAGVRRAPRLAPATTTLLVTAVQAAGIVFVVVCALEQRTLASVTFEEVIHRSFFSPATLLVAAAGAAALAGAARSEAVRARFAVWTRDTRARTFAAGTAAIALTAVWLLHAYNTEDTIGLAHPVVAINLEFTLDETFAVLDGRSPLVDFAAQYGSLLSYPLAGGMALLGETVGVWVGLSLLLTGAAMLAMYAVLRRVAHSAAAGLLLFAPFLATSFFMIDGPAENRSTYANYFGAYPLRFAGAFVLAWLVARHLDGVRPRGTWWLFGLAGLVLLNNADVGIPALGATLAALLWTGGRPTGARLGRLALHVVAGLVAALALVSLLTLLRAGSLPHLDLLVRYVRLFGAAGFGLQPMGTLGLHTVIYLTFVAAIGVATVRALRADGGGAGARAGGERALTGMLAWSGVFGLGTGAYYAGRSNLESLPYTFPMWSFTLALLTVVTLRAIAARGTRIPPPAQLACLFGFAVAACSLAQTPAPWTQLDRLARTGPPAFAQPTGQTLVAQRTRPGEPVAILMLLGHRIARNLGVENVSPYTGSQSMPAREQLGDVLDALRDAGGSKVFLSEEDTPPELQQALDRAGFAVAARDEATATVLWVDRSRDRPN